MDALQALKDRRVAGQPFGGPYKPPRPILTLASPSMSGRTKALREYTEWCQCRWLPRQYMYWWLQYGDGNEEEWNPDDENSQCRWYLREFENGTWPD